MVRFRGIRGQYCMLSLSLYQMANLFAVSGLIDDSEALTTSMSCSSCSNGRPWGVNSSPMKMPFKTPEMRCGVSTWNITPHAVRQSALAPLETSQSWYDVALWFRQMMPVVRMRVRGAVCCWFGEGQPAGERPIRMAVGVDAIVLY